MDRNLAAFLAVARSDTLTDAAHQLNLTQPSMTKRVANLEQELGVPLFTRHRRGMELTAAGAAYLPRAIRIEREHAQAREEVAAIAGAGLSELKIGAGPLFHLIYAAPLLSRLKTRYPNLAIDLIADSNVRTLPLLLSHELDIVLGLIDPDESNDTIMTVPATTVRHGIVLPKGDPHSCREAIEPADLTDKKWVLYTEDPYTENSIRDHFRRRGKAPPTIDVRTGSFSTGLQMVRDWGFAMSAPMQLSPLVEKEGLLIQPLVQGMPVRQAGLHFRPSSRKIAAVDFVIKTLPLLINQEES